MEDRYLFKAKRLDTDGWVIGNRVDSPDGRVAISETSGEWGLCECIPSTICQCTGLKDKNGKLIWENDIVKGKYYDNGKSHRHIGQVKYTCEAYKVVGVKQYTGYHARLDGSYEVIGNTIDNPELLEE